MARREPGVMLAPATWAQSPLKKEQDSAFIGAGTVFVLANSGYTLKRSSILWPMLALSNVVTLWLPGMIM